MSVRVTPADVSDAVEELVAEKDKDGVLVDAVVAELQAKLNLAGEHRETIGLNSSTVSTWIRDQIATRLGDDEFDRILDANTDG
jgi:hypothetical protein